MPHEEGLFIYHSEPDLYHILFLETWRKLLFFMADKNRCPKCASTRWSKYSLTVSDHHDDFCIFTTSCLMQKFRKCVIQKIIVLMNPVHYVLQTIFLRSFLKPKSLRFCSTSIILPTFAKGFVHISIKAWFLSHFISENMVKIVIFLLLLTVLSDLWSDIKRYPKFPLWI